MSGTNFGIIVIVLVIILVFALFFSTFERLKKLFNILSWMIAIALIVLTVYYFFLS